HAPAEQTCSAAQAIPHALQFFPSPVMSVHMPPQLMYPSAQSGTPLLSPVEEQANGSPAAVRNIIARILRINQSLTLKAPLRQRAQIGHQQRAIGAESGANPCSL